MKRLTLAAGTEKFLSKTANIIYFATFTYIYVRILCNLQNLIPGSPAKYASMVLVVALTLVCGVLVAKFVSMPLAMSCG